MLFYFRVICYTMATNSLVSYTAPTGDGTTFYIETYTGTSLHSTVGSFNGLKTIQPDVSYPFITTIDGHIAVDGGRGYMGHNHRRLILYVCNNHGQHPETRVIIVTTLS